MNNDDNDLLMVKLSRSDLNRILDCLLAASALNLAQGNFSELFPISSLVHKISKTIERSQNGRRML